jgi:bacteriocin biosynthesis cyclodehydratase domain-containing protein
VTTVPLRLPSLPARAPQQPPPQRAAAPAGARARRPAAGMGRPVLPTALRSVWRSHQALQIGLDPVRAVVVEGIDEPTARTLLDLDGTRTEAEVLAGAADAGLDADHVGGLLAELRAAGVLAEVTRATPPEPATPTHVGGRALGAVGAAGRLGPDLAALSLLPAPRSPLEVLRGRRAATVVVHGAGRVGASLGALLAAAGVGRVHVADRGPVRPGDVAPAGVAAGDVDRSRSAAAAEALRRAAPEVQATAPAPGRRPDLVVLASVEPVDTTLRTALAGGGVPHLVAGVRETTAVVGPLVLPGRTSCLHCADLHRSDRDPAWPVVAAQLVGIRRRREEPCDVTLATLAASLAAMQCLALLDGRPAAATGASLELSLTDWRLRRRSWPAHPGCDCGAAA